MEDSPSPLQALKSAIAVAGGQAALARMRKVSQPTVWGWVHKMGKLPAEHVLGVEADTGIPKEALRPDIYPRDVAPASQGSIASEGAGGEQSTTARADSVPDSLSGLSA